MSDVSGQRDLRVLHLATDAFGGHGGIALYHRDLIEAIAAHPRVRDVVVLPRHIAGALEAMPVNVEQVADGTGGKLSWARALIRLMTRRRDFDLVICGHLHLLPAAWLAAMICGTKPLLVIHGIEAWRPPSGWLARRLAGSIESFISISELTRQRFLHWSKCTAPGSLLPNAIHLERYAAGPRDAPMESRYALAGRRVLMTFGRLSAAEKYKGFDEVLAVLPSIVKKAPDVMYIIAGEGDDRPRLERRVAELGLAEHVRFTGYVKEEEKAALYSVADVYVMPSSGEGFGFVFLEAMASGVPAIGSRTDGGREALRDGQLGVLVDPADGEELRQAIMTALDHGTRQVPAGLEYFSFANFGERCHAIIDAFLMRNPRNGSR